MDDRNQALAYVTAWWRYDKDLGGYAFNHIEDGWSERDRPHDPTGKRWTRGQWHRCHAQLVPGGLLGARKLVLLEPAPVEAAASELETTSP